MSPEREETTDLYRSDRLRTFVRMFANSIVPMRANPIWSECYEMFPNGLQPAQACMLLKPGLPIAVTARYLAADGYVAGRYAQAMNFFCQPDHYLPPSEHELPLGHDDWVEQECVGEVDTGRTIRVPLLAKGELQVVLQAIEAIAMGELQITRWRPKRAFSFNDGYDSDEEQQRPRYSRGPKLRRIENRPEPEQKNIVASAPWSYQSQEGWRDRRSGLVIDGERFGEAYIALERSMINYRIPDSPGLEPESPVEPNSPAVVESPGGGIVCKISSDTAVKLNTGANLGYDGIVEVLRKAKPGVARFVASRLFDSFSGPWDAVLDTLVDDAVFAPMVRRGAAVAAFELVGSMQARFAAEVCAVLANSNIFKSTFEKIFRQVPTPNSLMKAIKDGRFDRVAQTRGFLDRIVEIKGKIDGALLFAESRGVYLPNLITAAQRGVPVQRSAVGQLGRNLSAMPGSVGNTLKRIGGGPRGFITDF